jgi:hypothetical protein
MAALLRRSFSAVAGFGGLRGGSGNRRGDCSGDFSGRFAFAFAFGALRGAFFNSAVAVAAFFAAFLSSLSYFKAATDAFLQQHVQGRLPKLVPRHEIGYFPVILGWREVGEREVVPTNERKNKT